MRDTNYFYAHTIKLAWLQLSGLIKLAAEDGTELAIGILIDDVDASAGNTKAVIIIRKAIVAHNAVIWPDTITGSVEEGRHRES